MSFSYDQSLGTTRDLVRFLIGDKSAENPKLADEEIAAQLLLTPDAYDAASACCRAIAASMADWIDQRQEAIDSKDSQAPAHYLALAEQLRRWKILAGGAAPWAGGLSQAAKDDRDTNTDLIQPMIRRSPNAPREAND